MSVNTETNGASPDAIIPQVLAMVQATEGFDDPSKPVLGETDDVIMAPNLEALLEQPNTLLATIGSEEAIEGFNLIVPIGVMDPSRRGESDETAYVYYTAINPAQRGRGLVKQLTGETVDLLKQHGYSFMEMDAVHRNRYAEKVQKNMEGAIVAWHDHENFGPEIGPERFFRIDLSKLPAA